MAALDIGFGMREYWRYDPSPRNNADGPSRGYPIGQAPKTRLELPLERPSELLEELEDMADVEEEDPFALLRLGRRVRVKLLKFYHICSGHTREGDLEFWICKIAANQGYLCEVVNVDLGFGKHFDLTDEVNVKRLIILASHDGDGGHAGPSCSTWSRVRFRPGGPPPLRFRWCLWGRPDLHVRDAEKVAKGNCLLLSSLRILEAIAPRGPVTLEHPADPGCPPYPSIFLTTEVQDWERRIGAVRVTFPQCQWGCPALKETTLTGTA